MQTFTSLICQLVNKNIHTHNCATARNKIVLIHAIHLLCVHGEVQARLDHYLLEEPPFSQVHHPFCWEPNTYFIHTQEHTNDGKEIPYSPETQLHKNTYLNNIFISLHIQ